MVHLRGTDGNTFFSRAEGYIRWTRSYFALVIADPLSETLRTREHDRPMARRPEDDEAQVAFFETAKHPKTHLRLPDLEFSKTAVLNSLTSVDGQRGYRALCDLGSSGSGQARLAAVPSF
jgi:hypothetical protein